LTPTESEVELLDQVPALDCEPLRGEDDGIDASVKAAIECTPLEGAVSRLVLLAFEDIAALRAHWRSEAAAFKPALDEAADACAKASTGIRDWGYGKVACRLRRGSAAVHWFDRRDPTYGVVEGDRPDLARLYGWWQENGRPIGRKASDEVASSPTPESDASAPSVADAMTSVVCDATSQPIADAWGRRWSVSKVTFLDQPRFERVVFHLARTDGARKRGGAELKVEPIPVSRLQRLVPEAPRPRRGRTVLYIPLENFADAPTIRSYRPSGVDLVKEFSLVRSGGTATALVAVPGGACYRVRVPVWGPSATGNERVAKIFVDIQK